METLANINNSLLLEGSRDNMLAIYLPLFQKKGMEVSLSQLKKALLAKFVNEGAMHNLSLESNYYLAGVAKYYFNGDLTTNKKLGIFYNKVDNFNQEVCQRLNALIPILRNAYIDSVGTQFEQQEDFGELTIKQLLRKYNKKINEALGIVTPKKSKEIPQEVEQPQIDQSTDAGANYSYEIIYDYEQCKKYNKYTEPGAWCITYGKQHYDSYIRRLGIHYVIFKQNGFENIQRKTGPGFTKRKPHDEYGNSLIALLQSNKDGHCVYITSRWNHGSYTDDTQGTEADHAYTTEEFLATIGCDESVLERCFTQWKYKIEQLKKESKNPEFSRKAVNAKNLDILRRFKYIQMKLNGGAKLEDVFIQTWVGNDNIERRSSLIYKVDGIDEMSNPNKSICRCSLNCDGEYYNVLVDKKKIIFDTIRLKESGYHTCKRYNNIIVYNIKGNNSDGEFVFYDLIHHQIIDFNGIKKIKHLSWDLAYRDVKKNPYKYAIFALNGNQVSLYDTEMCKFVKTPYGEIWYEKIIALSSKYYNRESVDYSGHIKCFDIHQTDILKLIYDSARGESYYFNCQTNSFIYITKIEETIGDGYFVSDVGGHIVLKDGNYIEAKKLVRKEDFIHYNGEIEKSCIPIFSYKYFNIRTNKELNFNDINEFNKVEFSDEMIAFEPFDSGKIYFYNKLKDKIVEFNGKPFVGNGKNKYGHLGMEEDSETRNYILSTNYQRPENVSYVYIPEIDYFYHDDINGYEFRYYGGGKVYRDKDNYNSTDNIYFLPSKNQIISKLKQQNEVNSSSSLNESKQIILNEIREKYMKNNIMKFINDCEGWKTYIKNSHWSSSNMNEHKLFDDIADSVSEIQDMVAEIAQGLYGQIKKGELKANKCTASGSKDFLSKMLTSTKSFYSTIEKGKDFIGMRSEIETFIGKISQYQYLMDLCLKEDFKRNFKKSVLSENKQHKQIKLNESEFEKYISECVKNVLNIIDGKKKL